MKLMKIIYYLKKCHGWDSNLRYNKNFVAFLYEIFILHKRKFPVFWWGNLKVFWILQAEEVTNSNKFNDSGTLNSYLYCDTWIKSTSSSFDENIRLLTDRRTFRLDSRSDKTLPFQTSPHAEKSAKKYKRKRHKQWFT